jgi:hypothetical protein
MKGDEIAAGEHRYVGARARVGSELDARFPIVRHRLYLARCPGAAKQEGS